MLSMSLWLTPMANRAKSLKETTVRALGKEGAVPPLVSWGRGIHEIEWAMAGEVDRDVGLRMAHTGIVGFNADWCVMGLETWASRSMISPLSGEKWEQNEMQRLAEQDPVMAASMLTEQLWFFRLSRGSDDVISDQMPFRVKGDRVRWLPTALMPHMEPRGWVIDAVKAMFTRPPLIDEAADHFDLLTADEDPQATIDRVIRRGMIETVGATVFLHPDDVSSAEVWQEAEPPDGP
jgi:hypothetical protein